MPFKFAANVSRLFGDLDFLDRFAAAKKAGFDAVEITTPVASLGFTAEEIKEAKDKAGVEIVLINGCTGSSNAKGAKWTRRGSLTYTNAGESGLTAVPHKKEQWRQDFDNLKNYARVLDCKRVHIMAGCKPGNIIDNEMEETYIENLKIAAKELEQEGVTALISFFSEATIPYYFLSSGKQAVRYLQEVNHPNLQLQLDIFQLQMTEGNLTKTIGDYLPYTAYIHVSQAPDRAEPSAEGEIMYKYVFSLLDDFDYDGYIGLKYTPQENTASSLKFLKDWNLM